MSLPIKRVILAATIAAVLCPGVAREAHAASHVAKPGPSSCTQNAPGVSVDNNWAWSAPGSWGLPGQQLTYAIHVTNYDVGCSSSSFVLSLSAPGGFSVSLPANTITLNSSSSGYLWAYVTAPSAIADGDYPLTVAVQRSGSSSPSAAYTSYYKVYSSDTVAPTLFWPNPADGGTISGRSYNLTVSSSDDHAVKKIDLYIDNVYRATTACDDISYTCQIVYKWSLRGATGPHTATFKSYDWLGNVGVLTVAFTVG
jgi:hypothetical protein